MTGYQVQRLLEATGITVFRAQQTKSPNTGNPCVRVQVLKTLPALPNEFHRAAVHVPGYRQPSKLEWRYLAY